MPELIGGLAALSAQIQYPEIARRAGIEGSVIVEFTVDEEGTVRDAHVVTGIGAGADEEALRAVRQAMFTPGMDDGEPVSVKMTLPVTFKLPNENHRFVFIEVADDGRIILNGQPASVDQLGSPPQGFDPESTMVMVRAGRDAPSSLVRDIQDHLRRWAKQIDYKAVE